MSYEPTVWKDGDLVTSAKLNKLEQGVANNILVVHTIYDEDTNITTLDKTWQEIYDAVPYVVFYCPSDNGEIWIEYLDRIFQYGIVTSCNQDLYNYYASSADDYPTDEEQAEPANNTPFN